MSDKINISTDKSMLDISLIYDFLNKSYWANNRSREEVATSIKNSICFGAYIDHQQIGFARVISDLVSFGYIADVFILPEYSGNNYAQKLMQAILLNPDLASVRKWYFITKDAQQLYKRFGFVAYENPEKTIMYLKPH